MNRNIAQKLAVIVEQFHSLSEILDHAVQLIARETGTDACSMLLLEPRDRRLHLLATCGLDKAALGKVSLAMHEGLVGLVLAERRPLAVELAAAHPAYRHFPETGEDQYQSFLGVPMTIRDRPIGVLVVQGRQRRVYREEEIRALEAISAQLVGIVASARLIEALDRGEAAEQALALRELPARRTGARSPGQALQGIAASPGIAIGTAVFRGAYRLDLDGEGGTGAGTSQGEEIERARLRDALEKTRNEILRIQRAVAQEADEEHALIFSSHLLLLNDPVLLARIDRSIASGQGAAVAVDRELQEFSQKLESVPDPYIQERVEDIHDLRSRLLGHLLPGGAHARIGGRIVIAPRIPPSLVVEIKAEGARGLITEVGGTTSHGILLARTLRLPVVTGVVDIAAYVRPDDQLILDGGSGTVIVDPPGEILAQYTAAAERLDRQRTEHARYRDLPARTADGVRVRLEANVSIGADLAVARENGAEGVGLYRTEFPFILREQFPTREEQIRIYRRAYEVFPHGPINFRLLDLGGDKFVPGGPVSGSRNPFHGYRSIRVLFDHPHVLTDQVQAFALAAAGRPLRILIPMISSIEELRRTKGLIAEALGKLDGPAVAPAVGVMIEVPAAVEIAGDLAREADFLSIGTNDLIQYSLVVDREDSRMTAAGDAYHPAILRMLRRIVRLVDGKQIGVCGEMAADPVLAALLIAMGVDELSVVPNAIPVLKQALAAVDVQALSAQLDQILAQPRAEDIRAALRTVAVSARDQGHGA